MLKKVSDCVLSRTSPCDVPLGYASLAALPAALPREGARLGAPGEEGGMESLFEHPVVI